MDQRSPLREVIERERPELSPEIRERLCLFYELVLKGNQKQNLTRIVEPELFYFANIVDAVAVIHSGLVDYAALDLGSGAGIPGLLCSILSEQPWILCESEGRKADFLHEAVEALDLKSVQISNMRAEDFLLTNQAKSVVCRAVGPVERIYKWIRKCSTWNNLVLLKGPSWHEEWKAFELTKKGKELRIKKESAYKSGDSDRIIVRIERVPRGTAQ